LRFTGKEGLPSEELRRALPYFEGAVYVPSAVQEGAAAIRRRLLAEGFPNAAVNVETTFDRRRFDARVTYRIEAGERARVAAPIFQGPIAPFTPEQLSAHARLKVGARYRESRALADANRMLEFLHREGRLKAQLELIAAQPTEDGRISPVYRASAGPEVVFEVQGVKPKKVEREVHQIIEGQFFDEDLILQYTEQQKQQLQRKGYYNARVSYSLDQAPERVTVNVNMDPGTRYSVERLTFVGNASVKDKVLRDLVVTSPRGIPILRPGRLTDGVLKDDVDTVLGYYQAHGWVGAKVGPPTVANGSRPDRLTVEIPIVEGVRTIVGARELVGVQHADTAGLEKLLAVRTGEPFNPNLLRQDSTTIRTYFQDRGWLEIAVRDEYVLSPDGTSAVVTYRVTEGERSYFGKTIVRGNTTTHTDRIRRVATWTEGAPFSEEKILEAQRQLSRTGAFRRVEVRPETADPGEVERNVQIEVQESRPISLLYGFGYQYVPEAAENRNDPFVVGGISTPNLFGSMRRAGLEGQIALSGRYRVQLSLRDPFLIRNDYPFTSVLFAARESIQDVDLERFGFVNEMSHLFGKYLRGSLRAEYQRVTILSGDLSTADLPLASQPIEEATVGPAFFYDRRDDVLAPHSGYYLSLAGKYAFPLFAADTKFTKFATQAAYFLPVGRAVLAVSGRFGGVFPYGDTSPLSVPLAERFFVGGRSTERAFQTDLLGIPGGTQASLDTDATVDYTTQATATADGGPGSCATQYPSATQFTNFDCVDGPRIVGGNAFVSLNAEIRIPIAGNLGAVVFYDAAQVWRRFTSMNLRFEGFDGLRQGAGAGLWFMLPVGPLRAEYSWKLTRRTIPFEIVNVDDTSETFCCFETRESAGQFYISIGFPF
ncbi:MAG TPA: POTRA domain-containing protein, partial [Thermoanaerobaculia bacterium]